MLDTLHPRAISLNALWIIPRLLANPRRRAVFTSAYKARCVGQFRSFAVQRSCKTSVDVGRGVGWWQRQRTPRRSGASGCLRSTRREKSCAAPGLRSSCGSCRSAFAGGPVLNNRKLFSSTASEVDGLPHVLLDKAWTPAAGGIYFVPADSPRSLRYFDFATKQIQPVFEVDEDFHSDSGLSVSSDGRWVLYSQDDKANGDIMLVDHFH
jgi:hypothetical protein